MPTTRRLHTVEGPKNTFISEFLGSAINSFSQLPTSRPLSLATVAVRDGQDTGP